MAVKTGPGPIVAAITGPPGPLVGGTSLRVTVQQDTAYSAVVVNDHMYPHPYIVFDPKGNML